MLLIMDNFEHLLSGVDLVTEILNTAPQVKVIATSRARLNIQGEQLFHLSGMDFPVWETPADALDYDAIKLFLQSANRIHLNFELTPNNLKYITRICRFVEGMPLGILLASSWLEMLAPEEIAGEIEKSLDFLETEQHDLPERQHSMRAVFVYSWKLLTPGEQNVFMKASVFRGGFTREAAQQVTSASLRDLMGLVDKSLLQRNPSGRYQIHELLRQYGAEKLSKIPDELDATRNQHSIFFAEFLHTREASLHGKNQRTVLNEIATEIENIKLGWEWAVEHVQIEHLADYLECIYELYDTRGWSGDGSKLFIQAIQKLSDVKVNDHSTQLLRGALNLLSCIGNVARVITGDAKGSTGVVTGKHGGIENVLVDFEDKALEKLAIGDKILIRGVGVGLSFTGYPHIKPMNISPELLKVFPIREDKTRHVLHIPVTHVIPAAIMGSGLCSQQCYRGDYDIQLFDQHMVEEYHLQTLRFGDVVAITDADHTIWEDL